MEMLQEVPRRVRFLEVVVGLLVLADFFAAAAKVLGVRRDEDG